jgi:hypothetical protein
VASSGNDDVYRTYSVEPSADLRRWSASGRDDDAAGLGCDMEDKVGRLFVFISWDRGPFIHFFYI